MRSWVKFWTQKIQRDQKKPPAATSEELGAKAGYCACPVHSAPPEGREEHLSHPSGRTPGHSATLTPLKEPARPLPGSKQARETVARSHCPALLQGPQQSLARIACLASSQFLSLAEGQEPWSVSRRGSAALQRVSLLCRADQGTSHELLYLDCLNSKRLLTAAQTCGEIQRGEVGLPSKKWLL